MEQGRDQKADSFAVCFINLFVGGAALFVLGTALGGHLGSVNPLGILVLLYLAFICGAGYVLWALLMKNNPVSRIAIFGFVNLVVNVLLSAVLNGEPLFRWRYLAALVFVCVGIWLVNKAPAQKGEGMTGPIFDTHAHYSARAFDADRFALLDSLPAKGVVGVCEQATHPGTPPGAGAGPPLPLGGGGHWHPSGKPAACRRLRRRWPRPHGVGIRRRLGGRNARPCPCYEDPKVVAVGECGLDYHWPVPKDAQLALFEAEIRLALELDKPIIVHDRQAHADVYALLKSTGPRASSTAIPAVRMTPCGWHSRVCTLALAVPAPSREPSERQKPLPPCRWKPSCWRRTAPIWPRSRCAAPAATAASSTMWVSTSPS